MTHGAQENRAVWLLAIGQTLTYAALYYGFAALLPDLELATGWSKAQLAAGPTLAFLITAVLTPVTGRFVDLGWGGEMLVGLPVLGGLAMVGLGFAATPLQWLLLWAVIGVAQAGSFYETCFAFLTRRLADGARAAIIRITLVAGFASTLSFPLGAVLGQGFGGQGALIALSGLIFLGALPANALGVVMLRRLHRSGARVAMEADPAALARALRHPAFWGIAAIFGLIWLNHAILITYALVLFADRGAGPGMAVLAAATIGPSQVIGRLILMLNEVRIGNRAATLFSLAAIVAATGVLALAGVAPVLVFGFAVLQGAGAGLLSILRPVLLAEKLGRAGFGAISGAVAVSPILATAAGPSVGAFLLEQGGAGAVYAACALMAALGLAIGVWLLRRQAD